VSIDVAFPASFGGAAVRRRGGAAARRRGGAAARLSFGSPWARSKSRKNLERSR